jgi:hypothetical protein
MKAVLPERKSDIHGQRVSKVEQAAANIRYQVPIPADTHYLSIVKWGRGPSIGILRDDGIRGIRWEVKGPQTTTINPAAFRHPSMISSSSDSNSVKN